ncbi:MAG TPA: RidA family protein [Alphaproteobacteria bacterium]
MSGRIAARLDQLGIALPPPFPPRGSYVGAVVTGHLVYVAGQGPIIDGKPGYVGKLGRDLSVEDGYKAARQTALQILAEVQHAVPGGLDCVTRVVKLFGLVNCTADFTEQARVINGASDLMAEIFGEAGKHARVAVGAETLPFGIAVEIDGIFEIE